MEITEVECDGHYSHQERERSSALGHLTGSEQDRGREVDSIGVRGGLRRQCLHHISLVSSKPGVLRQQLLDARAPMECGWSLDPTPHRHEYP
jgi:hypothetical protein